MARLWGQEILGTVDLPTPQPLSRSGLALSGCRRSRREVPTGSGVHLDVGGDGQHGQLRGGQCLHLPESRRRQKPKSFRPWNPEQTTLLPPSPSDWLSVDHQVYFLLDLVDELDLSHVLIPAQSKDPRGEKGFDPRM